jgi:hypothetical protein
VAGLKVQLGGQANLSLFTDPAGMYLQTVAPGQYTIEPTDSRYLFFPPSRAVTIVQDDSIGNDFEGFLNGPSPKPALLSISPTTTEVRLTPNASPLFLTAAGSDFVPGAKLFLNNVAVPTQFVSETSLTASIPATSLEAGGALQVFVENPSPSFGPSGTVTLTVNNVGPILNSVDPASLTFDPAIPTPLTLSGLNFGPSSIFELTGPCAVVFVSNRISTDSAVLTLRPQCAGTYYVRVRTPPPGGGVSQTLPIMVR